MNIGGSFGAQLCSEKFCSSVHTDLSANLPIPSTAIAPAQTSATSDMTTTPIITPATITPTFETQLCESIYKTSKLLNRELKSRSKTGTTMTSLFIHQNLCHNSDPSTPNTTPNTTNSYTIYCANIGDSRCIMLYNDAVTPLSYDHNLKNECEVRRIERHESVPWSPKAYKIIPNKNVNHLKKAKAGYTLENTTAHELSCDDNDTDNIHMNINTFALTSSGHNSDPSPSITPDLDEDSDLIKLPIIHAQSFISQRISNKGVPTGPTGTYIYLQYTMST